MACFSVSNILFDKPSFIILVLLNLMTKSSANIEQQLSLCLEEIAKRHVDPASTILISYGGIGPTTVCNRTTAETSQKMLPCSATGIWEPIFISLHNADNWNMMVIALEDVDMTNVLIHRKYAMYILVSEHQQLDAVVNNLVQQVTKLKTSFDWNPRAKFVVILTEVNIVGENASRDISENIFTELWKFKIVNVIIILKARHTIDMTRGGKFHEALFDIFTWFPYHPPGRCAEDKSGILIERWIGDGSSLGHFLNNTHLFPPKIPKDLHGCPLLVSIFEYQPLVSVKKYTSNPRRVLYDEGIEVKLLEVLTRFTNMTIAFKEPPADGWLWGFQLPNGSWTGVSGEIIRSESDIAMDNYWYRCHLINEIECLTPHLSDEVRWYVPCAQPYPRWTSLTRVFKGSLWLGFLAAFIFFSFVMWYVVKLSYVVASPEVQNQNYVGITKCFLNFWAIILEESANDTPHILSIRSIFLAWVIYCWAVNTIYQTFLTSFLVDPGLQHQLSSEEEILTSDVRLGIPPTVVSVLPGLGHKKYRRNRANCDDVTVCQDRMAFKGDLALLFSKYHLDYVIAAKYIDGNGNPLACKFDEVYCIQFVTFPVPKGMVMLHLFNGIIQHVKEAGLLSQWWKSIQYITTLKAALGIEEIDSEYIVLAVEHLQSAFYFLFLGYGFCLLTFIGELMRKSKNLKKICCNRRSKTKTDKN
ncbi:Ionotropic receptor 201 [Blattella germanica]|nr:Ionotropic receptor 201 [Blattella germanica]